MKNNISGVGVALVTPFSNDGGVDYSALGRLVNYVIENGVDYIVGLGTTGETPTLSAEEKAGVINCIKENNKGRVPLVIGVGGYSTSEVIKTIEKTDLNGASAVLSVTPYYNKPSQEGLYQHYKAIAESSPVPIILYNVPGRTGVNLSAQTTIRIANEIDNVLGIKEACGTIGQMAQILQGRPDGFKVISGDDCMAVPLIALGGDGVISVAANAFPKEFCEMICAAYSGNREKTSEIFLSLFEVMEALFEEGNPAGIKAVLELKGMIGCGVRLPLVGCSERLFKKFNILLKRYEL